MTAVEVTPHEDQIHDEASSKQEDELLEVRLSLNIILYKFNKNDPTSIFLLIIIIIIAAAAACKHFDEAEKLLHFALCEL